MWTIEWKSGVKYCEIDMMRFERIISLILFFVCATADNVRNDKTCGVVASANVIHQHPWLVVLEYHYNRETDGIRCGGTLISSRHILTSAHCVGLGLSPVIMLPRLGEYNMSSDRDCVGDVCADPVVRMVLQKVFVHPGFRRDRSLSGNDLAILVLETEAPYTDFIRPVCLPSGVLDEDTEFSASGFGATPHDDSYSDVKKNIPLPYYPHCRRIYIHLARDLLCAGGIRNFDTCRGDSGGPLVRMDDSRAELWGVTKGGHNICGFPGIPGVYTSVMYHLNWINKIIDMTTESQDKNLGQRQRGSAFVLFLVVFVALNI